MLAVVAAVEVVVDVSDGLAVELGAALESELVLVAQPAVSGARAALASTASTTLRFMPVPMRDVARLAALPPIAAI